MLGNLARASYVGSSDFVWPYSYNKCDSRNRKSQEINACSVVNHYGLESFTGRGSPEIDVLEAMQGESGKLPNTFIQRPYQSTSLQVAPGIEIDRPILGKRPNPVSNRLPPRPAALSPSLNHTHLLAEALVYGHGVLEKERIRSKSFLLRCNFSSSRKVNNISVRRPVRQSPAKHNTLQSTAYLSCRMGAAGGKWNGGLHKVVYGWRDDLWSERSDVGHNADGDSE